MAHFQNAVHAYYMIKILKISLKQEKQENLHIFFYRLLFAI